MAISSAVPLSTPAVRSSGVIGARVIRFASTSAIHGRVTLNAAPLLNLVLLPDVGDVVADEARTLAEAGLATWVASLPDEDTADMVAPEAWRAVRWEPGVGWVEWAPA